MNNTTTSNTSNIISIYIGLCDHVIVRLRILEDLPPLTHISIDNSALSQEYMYAQLSFILKRGKRIYSNMQFRC
jgi:hypothetical protein